MSMTAILFFAESTLARMNRAAVFALAQVFVRVELLKQRRQVAHDAFQFHFRAMHELMTVLAIPLETIQSTLWTRHLNHHANSSCSTLRGMPHVFRKQKDFTFLDWKFDGRLARRFHQTKNDVAFQLVKELLGWIVVVISALVGTSDHSHHHLAVFPYLRVAHRRLELFLVVLYPALKIECLQFLDRWHSCSYCSGLYATTRISTSRCGCGNWCTATVVRAGPS